MLPAEKIDATIREAMGENSSDESWGLGTLNAIWLEDIARPIARAIERAVLESAQPKRETINVMDTVAAQHAKLLESAQPVGQLKRIERLAEEILGDANSLRQGNSTEQDQHAIDMILESALEIGTLVNRSTQAAPPAAQPVGPVGQEDEREILNGWKIEPTQVEGELSIVPPMVMKNGRKIQPRGICAASWSTCDDSRILYSLAKAVAEARAALPVAPAVSEPLQIALDALDRIAEPLAWEQRNLKDGYDLNVPMLLSMLDKPEYFRAAARDALAHLGLVAL